MKLTLLNRPSNLLSTASGSALTCYSGQGLVTPEQAVESGKCASIFADVYKSGHHTTLQHVNLNIGISGVSRMFVWKFLHNHHFYNSEQISQRFVSAEKQTNGMSVFMPNAVYQVKARKLLDTYDKLKDILVSYFEKGHPNNFAVKKAQEFARYVLPQNMQCELYHSISLVTALRYINACKNQVGVSGVVEEATIFGQQLRKLLIDYKPQLEEYIADAETEPAHDPGVNPYNTFGVKLVSEMKNNVNVYNVSPILWDLPEDGLINYVHKLKPYTVVSDGINLGTINMVSRMSLSCDAQNQRHRTTTRYTPSILDGFAQYKNEILKLVKTEENDIAGIIDTKVFYTPELFKSVPEALELYARTMHDLYKFIYAEYIEISDIMSDDKFLDELFLLLPNSHMVDVFESYHIGDFINNTQLRMCRNAQEEISNLRLEQIRQVTEKCPTDDPGILGLMAPPCVNRHRFAIYPTCPEGKRFCGTKVWEHRDNWVSPRIY